MKRILLVNYEYPPVGGGGGISAHELAREWSKSAEVDVLTSSYEDLASFEKMEGVNVYRVKVLFRNSRDTATLLSMLSYVVFGFFKGISLCNKNKYDVINTHFAVPSGPLGYILGKMFKIVNVLSLHGGDIYDPSKKLSPHKSPVFKRVVNFILNKADYIVAQSSNTKANTRKFYKCKKKIDIVPLAFTPPEIKKTSKRALGFKKGQFVLVAIGRLVKRKAFEVAVKTVAEIDKNNVVLYIVGDGPEKEYLQSVINENNVEDRVFLTGYLDNEKKYQLLSNADLMLMTSLHEGFGIIFQEAMYCGLPVVCTNNGGQVDIIHNEKNGLLCDVGDVKTLSKSVLRFVNNKELYKKCSQNNKRDIKMLFADRVAAQYLDIYKKLSKESAE